MAKGNVALQLYTVRSEMAKDFEGTVRRVAEIGYPAVEFAGTGGLSSEVLVALLKETGLKAAGTHTGIDEAERDFESVVRLHHAMECGYLTVPSLPRRYSRDEAGFAQAGRDLDALGARLRREGIQLAYHNHNHEFVRVGDGYGLDVLYANSDPDNVHAELDAFWCKRGGEDPAAYIRKLGRRCSLVHIKDMTPDGDFAEVGAGTMDFDPLFQAGDAVGARWYIVEQDACKGSALDAIGVSLDNLRRWGRV